MSATEVPRHNYNVVDYTQHYRPIMQFNKNKTASIHQWYSFVEGYSKEFINSIVNELDYAPKNALDPFAGSGTTPLELQELGIQCHSFEVSPFMHLLATVKMYTGYKISDFDESISKVVDILSNTNRDIRLSIPLPLARTMYEQDHLSKWIFNKDVIDGILDIKFAIKYVSSGIYRNLFKIALASILLEVSNVYRNGKCLSYKKNWQQNVSVSRHKVHELFLNKLTEVIRPDIELLDQRSTVYSVNNQQYCQVGDVRKLLNNIENESIDLVITSPPYLNSRDYTDIYIAELWILDLIGNYEELKKLRHDTLRSHVQVPMNNIELLEINELKMVIKELNGLPKKLWNRNIGGMIKGYFLDMDGLFFTLNNKLKINSKIFFNVANSAYYGVEVKVDEIVSAIAETNGFRIVEIREARKLKPSSQQKNLVNGLRESVIVMEKS